MFPMRAVFALLAVGFAFAAAENLANVHVAFAAGGCILGVIAASQLLGMAQGEGLSLALYAGITSYATAVAEAFHLLTSVAWTQSIPLLQPPAQNLGPHTWPFTAFVPALGMIAALGLSRRARPMVAGWFAPLRRSLARLLDSSMVGTGEQALDFIGNTLASSFHRAGKWAGGRYVFVLALAALSCHADDTTQSGVAELKKMNLEEFMSVEVTTVSRTESTVGQSPAAITVVSQEEIRRSGATTIPELFRMVPGMDVAPDGS